SNIARNANWISTEYNNQNSPSTFYTLGAEELQPARTFTQSAYRLFANIDGADVGSALALQDTAASLSSNGDAFRLRQLLHVGGTNLGVSGDNFKLQFAEKSGTCDTGFTGETYADVTGATAIAYNNNATPNDNDMLTANADDPVHGIDTVANQTYEEINNFTNSVAAINAGQDGKWDFSLIDNDGAASKNYCFRAVKSDGSLLDTYTVIPEVTTAGAPDTTPPTVTEVTPVTTPTNDSTPDYTFNTDEDGTITYGGDCSSVATSATAGNNTVTFNLLSDGAHSNCTITVTDAASNVSTPLAVTSFTIDTTAPSVSLTSGAPDPTNTSPIPVAATFSESVTGFALSDITVGNGTASNLLGSGTAYTFDVTPTANGAVTVDVGGGAAADSAGNGNTAASQFSIVYDGTPPTVSSITRANSTPTNAESINFTVTFSESVSGIATNDFSLTTTGVSGASITSVSAPSGSSVTVAVNTGMGNGTIRLDVPNTATITDAASNNLSNVPFASGEVYDINKTALTLNITAPSLTNTAPILVGVTFSASVADFASTDVTLSSGSVTTFAGSGTSYTFNITAPSEGSITITIPAAVAHDDAGNANLLTTLNIIYDITIPQLTEVTAVPALSNDTTPSYTFSSTEAGNITYGGSCGTALPSTASVGNNTVTYGTLADGTYSNCTIKVTDGADNDSSTLNVLAFAVDTTPPPSPSPSRSTSGSYILLSATAPVISPPLFSPIQTETSTLFLAASSGEEQNGSGQVFAVTSQLITQGARGDQVRDLQILLLSQGFNPGPIDGIFGPKTCSSLKQFQSANSLIADCIVGPKTQKVLADRKSEESEYSQEKIKEFQRNLGFGDSGPDVQNLQKFLNQQGFAVAEEGPGASGQETKLFGQRTESALRRFQEFIAEQNPAVVGQVVSSGFLDFLTRAYINRLLGEF
ncbi:MAG TPA: peptidoglycan-binding protein, partial [Candidatus Paceibacterota bacterium]